MKILIQPSHVIDCGAFPLAVELHADNMVAQTYYAYQLVGSNVVNFKVYAEEADYKKAVMTELKRRMPNLNSVQKKKSGEVYAVTRSYQGKMFVDHLMPISADPAPHREDYIFYP